MYQNPHVLTHSGGDYPEPLGNNPLPEPVTDLGKEALALRKAAEDATARLDGIRESRADLARRITVARAAWEAEVMRGAREGIDQGAEDKLSIELSALERSHNEDVFRARWRVATQTQRELTVAWRAFIWQHWSALVDGELREDAERVSAELVKALASIQPKQQAYDAVAARAWDLTRFLAHGPDMQWWATNSQLPPAPAAPLPPQELLDHKYNLENPAPEAEPELVTANSGDRES
jgi:hypothetical protein